MSSFATYPTPVKAEIPAVANLKKKNDVSPLLSLVAGGVAGGVEATITYPFEFMKTRSQLRSNSNAALQSLFKTFQNIAKTEGLGAIYTGCSTLVVGTAFKASVRFLTFDSIKNVLSDRSTGKLSPSRGIVAGMAAGCVESIVAVTPTERLKTALIDDAKSAKRFHGTSHALKLLIQEQGLSGLYKGFLSTTLKQSATSGVRMGSYNILRDLSRTYQIPQNTATTFGTGAIAGVITVYATQPFDTIKTRAQSAVGASTIQAMRSVMVESGIRGFWNGSTMRLGRLIFSGGIVFSVYEGIVGFVRGGV